MNDRLGVLGNDLALFALLGLLCSCASSRTQTPATQTIPDGQRFGRVFVRGPETISPADLPIRGQVSGDIAFATSMDVMIMYKNFEDALREELGKAGFDVLELGASPPDSTLGIRYAVSDLVVSVWAMQDFRTGTKSQVYRGIESFTLSIDYVDDNGQSYGRAELHSKTGDQLKQAKKLGRNLGHATRDKFGARR